VGGTVGEGAAVNLGWLQGGFAWGLQCGLDWIWWTDCAYTCGCLIATSAHTAAVIASPLYLSEPRSIPNGWQGGDSLNAGESPESSDTAGGVEASEAVAVNAPSRQARRSCQQACRLQIGLL